MSIISLCLYEYYKSAYCETRTGLGLGLGPVQNPDSRKTQTGEKPGLDTRTYLRKKPDLSPQNPDSINEKKLNSKLDSLKNVVLHPFSKLRDRKNLVTNVSFPKRTAINGNDERKYISKLYFCNNHH